MDAPEGRDRPLSVAADWFIAAWLVVLGTGVVVSHSLFGEGPEGQVRALRVATGVLCVVVAMLYVLVRRTRRDLRRLDELLTDVRFGSGTRRDRDAVDILVTALRTSDERARETALRTLRKISGLDLGPDAGPWEIWWRAARKTFVRAPAGAPGAAQEKK